MKFALFAFLSSPLLVQAAGLGQLRGPRRDDQDRILSFVGEQQEQYSGEACQLFANNVDADLVVNGNPIVDFTLPAQTSTTTGEPDWTQVAVFSMCEAIPVGTTVVCSWTDCTGTSGSFASVDMNILESDAANSGYCIQSYGRGYSDDGSCPTAFVYHTFTQDVTVGYLVVTQDNGDDKTATANIKCYSDNYTPRTQACGAPFGTDCWNTIFGGFN